MQIRIVAVLSLGVAAFAAAAPEPSIPGTTVRELMIDIVTPATDALWGVEDPRTDAEWRVLDDAARDVIDVFRSIKLKEADRNDGSRPAQPNWDAYTDEVISAAEAARQAIGARDVDALLEAGNVLYPPCENCHLEYHPGVKGQSR